MSGIEVEKCLATLYTNAVARQQFFQTPEIILGQFELTEMERSGLLKIDRVGLAVAGDFFGAKRARYSRWMHACVRSVHCFERLIEPALLDAAYVEVARNEANQNHSIDRETQDVVDSGDFFPWNPNNHHNREYLLLEREEAAAVSDIWRILKAGALKNHHLLRCYAASVAHKNKLGLQSHDADPGTYLTYVALFPDKFGLWSANLVLSAEGGSKLRGYSVKRGTTLIVPAHMLQGFELQNSSENRTSPVVLAFKTLAAIQ